MDPEAIDTRTELARGLTMLRENQGLTVRELARRLGIPAATLGGYLSGRHLPSAAQLMTFTGVLRECGVTTDHDVRGWVNALGRARASSDRRGMRAEAPYRGLEPFGPDDADSFFGRSALTSEILERVTTLRTTPGARTSMLAVVGASGSGKSSLLNAGLVPAFRATVGSAVSIMTPGATPRLDQAAIPELLVVDQFEELFTLADPGARDRFLAELARLDPRVTSVVLGLRADFYEAAMGQPLLVAALQHNQMLVTPMSPAELEAAIVQPAARAGTRVDADLVAAVLADLAPAGTRGRAHDPGALPLMSHALLSAWTRSTRHRLTVENYRDAGGIGGAVQQTAEELYRELDPIAQHLSRRLFMRLVTVDDETALTRRRVTRREIRELADPTEIDALVEIYVDRRLITSDIDSVQISHDALLMAWPRLHDWVDADRDGARVHRLLTDAANDWDGADRDPTLLLTGMRLSTAADWREDANHANELSRLEAEFVDASVRRDDRQRRSERQQNLRLKRLLALVAGLAIAAIVLTVLAARSRQQADDQRQDAAAARDQALSRQIAGEVGDLSDTTPNLSAQLAVAGYHVSATVEARSALLDRTALPMPTRLVTRQQNPLQALAESSSRKLLAAAGVDGLVHLWRTDTAVPTALAALRPAGAAGTVFALAFSPDGSTLFAGGGNKLVTVWDLRGPGRIRRSAVLRSFGNTVFSLAVSPDGTQLAAGSADGSVHRWTVTDPDHPIALPALAKLGSFVQCVAFDRFGTRLAVGLADGSVDVFAVGGRRARRLSSMRASTGAQVFAVAFDPSADLVAAGTGADEVRVWRLGTGTRPTALYTRHDATTQINAIAFSPDATTMAVGSSDQGLREYAPASGQPIQVLPTAAPVTAIVFRPDATMTTASVDGSVEVWPSGSSTLRGPTAKVFNVAVSRDGSLLAIGAGSEDGTIELWRTGVRPSRTAVIRSPDSSDPLDGSASMSPDGQLVSSGTTGGRVYLFDIHDPAAPRLVGRLPDRSDPTALVENTAFSADGRLVAAAGDDRAVRLWDVTVLTAPRLIAVLDDPGNFVYSPTFSRDGRYLAAGSADEHAYVWRLHGTRSPPTLTARLGGFTSYVYAAAFSSTSDLLAVADSRVRLYAPDADGSFMRTRPLLDQSTNSIYGLAFSPDGTTLAAASQDDHAYVWHLPDAALLAALTVSPDGLFGVAFGDDGRTLYAADADMTVHSWLVDPDAAADAICARAGTSLSRTEWAQYVPGTAYRPPCA